MCALSTNNFKPADLRHLHAGHSTFHTSCVIYPNSRCEVQSGHTWGPQARCPDCQQ